jgi:ubiquinone/menaquinone biosynthesis C-methylase UbiE
MPTSFRVNYDKLATGFDARYKPGLYDGVLRTLRAFILEKRPEIILEAGCGTGYWLSALRDVLPRMYGLDYSREMLRKARSRDSGAGLVRATAKRLPFRSGTVDLIFCVNALHHLERLDEFVAEARRVVRRGGTLAAIGMDPHHGHDHWCVYDYFPEAKEADLIRYPSSGQVTDALLRAGFDKVDCRVACRLSQTQVGQAVLEDPELQRNGCSQMALLTDEQYAAGIERIKATLLLSECGEPPSFGANIAMMMYCGYVD